MGTPSQIVVTRRDGEQLRALHLDNRPQLTLSVLADLTYQTIHPTRRRRIMGVWGQADILECLVEQGISPKDESELNEDMVASYPVTDVDEMLLYEIALDGYGAGYAEVFIDGNEYVHVGLQFWINRSWWSGMTGNRSKEKDVASAMFGGVNNTYERRKFKGPSPLHRHSNPCGGFETRQQCVYSSTNRSTLQNSPSGSSTASIGIPPRKSGVGVNPLRRTA